MSSIIRDPWPDDIRSDDVISPAEILSHQAELLEEKTGGLREGDVVRHESQDRIVLGFEVVAQRVDTRARLFEVQHRLEYEYPAAIVPPDLDPPDSLKERVYRSGARIVGLATAMRGGHRVENKGIASSPAEFSARVQSVLARPAVKAVVLSLLARSRPQDTAGSGNPS